MAQNTNQNIDHGKKFLSWQFPEYIKYEREKSWYIIVGLISLGIIIYSIVTANILFVILLILFMTIITLHNRHEPMDVLCDIFEDGIAVGSQFYEWSDIKNFRIVYQPPDVKKFYIDLKNNLLQDFSIPLEDQSPLMVRDILKKYLKEDLSKTEETLTDRLNRWLKI
ncbi:MAG: DUF5673 domain-containing protein [Patescibacteria group bacterium]|jgi:hypothetical protein